MLVRLNLQQSNFNKMEKNIDLDFQKMEKIGEGAYGAVYKIRSKINKDQVYALKVTKFDRDDQGVPSTALREISILKSLNHPNILKLLEIKVKQGCENNQIHLLFDFLDQDLGKFIRQNTTPIPQAQYKRIFFQIVKGIHYMHSRHIYHRDLKPQNILITKKGQVKIADFGLSRMIINPNKTYSKEIETLWYRSPELLLGQKYYDSGVDIWSLGCILYELAEGKVLFKGDSEISQIFKIFEYLGTPREKEWPKVISLPFFKKRFPKMNPKQKQFKNLGETGVALLFSLLQMNPKKRIGIEETIRHPFFKDLL